MVREPKEVWVGRVARYKKSGLSMKKFAVSEGVNYHTLSTWKQRLDGESNAAKQTRRPPSVALVELELHGGGSPFQIHLPNGASIRVAADFNEGSLRRLLGSLGALG